MDVIINANEKSTKLNRQFVVIFYKYDIFLFF